MHGWMAGMGHLLCQLGLRGRSGLPSAMSGAMHTVK
jgi:hypothetical protein